MAQTGSETSPMHWLSIWLAVIRLVGMEGMRFYPDAQPNIFDYRIISVLPITGVTPWMENQSWYDPGLIDVKIVERWCTSDCTQFYELSFAPFIYYLRRDGGEWRLAAWTNDTSVTCEYPEPDNPACNVFFWDNDLPWVHDESSYNSY